jgi:hypothetical protein
MKILDAYSDEVWEQRRYEIAKSAVRQADALIAELKKKGE